MEYLYVANDASSRARPDKSMQNGIKIGPQNLPGDATVGAHQINDILL